MGRRARHPTGPFRPGRLGPPLQGYRPWCPQREEVQQMQRRFIALAAIIVTCGLGSALTASAALPKKGAEYQGVIKSTPFEMRVLLGVSATGKKLRFTYACG